MRLNKKRKVLALIYIFIIILVIFISNLVIDSVKGCKIDDLNGYTFIQNNLHEYLKFDSNDNIYYCNEKEYSFTYELLNESLKIEYEDNMKEFVLLNSGLIDKESNSYYYKIESSQLYEKD